MTEIDIHRPALPAHQPTALEQKMMYAEYLAKGDLLPSVYRGKPWNIILVGELGEEFGLTFAQSLRLIHVIDNVPTASVRLLAARVRLAGHTMRVAYDQKNRTATVSGHRGDDPGHEHIVQWSWDRATAVVDGKGNKLTDKANWRNYYPAMLKWRAQGEWVGDMCPEVALGVHYSPDEMGSQYITEEEADDEGLMTTHMLTEHGALERTPHDRSKTERIRSRDEDPQADLWATDSPPATAEDDNPLHRQPGEES